MTDDAEEETRERHVRTRAHLLPEERAVGSEDPQAQAEAILADSEDRTQHPDPDVSTQSRRSSNDNPA